MAKRFIIFLSAGLLLGFCLALPSMLSKQAGAETTDVGTPVTTDTLEYCIVLGRELARLPDPPEAARLLAAQGEELCRDGQIRGGILRMRRAMVLLHSNSAMR